MLNKIILTIFLAVSVQAQVGRGFFPSSNDNNNNLLTGLLVAWELDEASGNGTDSSGNGRTLTEAGTVGSAAGKVDDARTFSAGSDTDALTIASASWNSFGTNAFTISAWVNMTLVAPEELADQYFLSKYDATANAASWVLLFDDSGPSPTENSFLFAFSTNGTAINVSLAYQWATNITSNTWYFVCVRRDPTNDVIKMTVTPEGYPTVETDITTALADDMPLYDNNAVPVIIGSFYSGGALDTGLGDIGGRVDSVRMWNRSLSDCEVGKLYANGSGIPYVDLDALPCN